MNYILLKLIIFTPYKKSPGIRKQAKNFYAEFLHS